MTYDRTDRIRRAAILVTSLDEALAHQILAELPPVERARVLDAAERLDEIDADEQQDVLAEFRRLARSSRGGAGGVEFAASHNDSADGDERQAAKQAPSVASEAAQPTLSDADAAAMAELLSQEHPQIIAAALSRLGDDQSPAVFAALPPSLQAEALSRLASLAPADEEAVQEVESQLQRRLQQRRESAARSAAGAELVRKILSCTPAAQRVVLLERLAAKTPANSAPLQSTPTATQTARRLPEQDPAPAFAVDPLAQQAKNLALAVRRARANGVHQAAQQEDRTEELELLDDDALVAALRVAGEQTVLRALAASGEAFVSRVTGMLPRRQGRKLRRMLYDLGPTRLADLHAAQHELLRLAHDCASAGIRQAQSA